MDGTIEHTEIIERYLNIIDELNNIDLYWEEARTRKEDMEKRLSDILHFIEELDYYNVSLTANQCKNLIDLIKDFRQIRRVYKKEEILYDTMDSNKQKMSYRNQRPMLVSELCKKEKSLQTTYKPRVLQYDEIWNMITNTTGRGRKPKNKFEMETE